MSVENYLSLGYNTINISLPNIIMVDTEPQSLPEPDVLWQQQPPHSSLMDFKGISKLAFTRYNQQLERPAFPGGNDGTPLRFGLIALYSNGIAWYGEGEGSREEPIGKPEDYLEIRDDFAALQGFIGRTLDRGRIFRGVGGHAPTEDETNTADYIKWLHKYSENPEFKGNLEKAVVGLLEDELSRDFVPYDYATGRERAEDNFRIVEGGSIDRYGRLVFAGDLHDALWRAGLDHPETAEDVKFKKRFEEEMGKTLRPLTLEESLSRSYTRTEEDRQRSINIYEQFQKDRPVVHFSETSPEFKVAFQERHLDGIARRNAVEAFTPQFNRLVGLLGIVAEAGEQNNGFAKAYDVLKQRAEMGFSQKFPSLRYSRSQADIYNHELIALSAVQPRGELQRFWLNNIEADPNPNRVITSVHGLLAVFDSQGERQRQIPQILQALQGRGYDVDRKRYYEAIGFIFDENLLEQTLAHLRNMCFDKDAFFHLDKEHAALNVLDDRKIEPGVYSFQMQRFTPDGTRVLSATYDLDADAVQGDTELEGAVRSYFEKGYELPNDVWVTSLEGRMGNDKKYEGILGIDYSYFPFIYDRTEATVLLAEPIETRTTIFGRHGEWEERRIGLERLPEQAKFMPLSEIGQVVHEVVETKRANRAIGDSIYTLDGKLSTVVEPHMKAVIEARLIKHRDGLVE